METEVKLQFNSNDDLEKIKSDSWFIGFVSGISGFKKRLLINNYFDTSNLDLRAETITVRIRKYCDANNEFSIEHTVKYGSGSVDGLYQRHEWNANINKEFFDKDIFLTAIIKNNNSDESNEILVNILKNVNCNELQKIFYTEVTRTTCILNYNTSTIEACFDIGKAVAGNLSDNICELELELIDGNIDDLKHVADIVKSHTNAYPSDISKFKRCLMLLEKQGKYDKL